MWLNHLKLKPFLEAAQSSILGFPSIVKAGY